MNLREFFKERRRRKEEFRLLQIEVEKQGITLLASQLDTAEEQREVIEKYFKMKNNMKIRWY